MFAQLSKLLLFTVLFKVVVEEEVVAPLQVSLTSKAIKDISNYTFTFESSEWRDHVDNSTLIQIIFSDAFLVWLRPYVILKEIGGQNTLAEVSVIDNKVSFSAKLLNLQEEEISFTLLDIVNPSTLATLSGIELQILNKDHPSMKFRSQDLKFINKLGKVQVNNPHSQFIPGFYTSPFRVTLDTFVAYKVTLNILSDSRFITPVPATIDLEWERLVFENNNIRPAEQINYSFRLAVKKETPPGKYTIRFHLTEDNTINNYLPVEVVEFTVGFPDNVYSAIAPKPFNGPLPFLRFNQPVYHAPLGGHSALKTIELEPPATEDFQIEIRSILPPQPDKVMVHPNKVMLQAGQSKVDFYLEPKVGSVSGSLQLQVPDLFFKTNTIIKDKRASFDVIYNEVESDHAKLFVDERPLHAVSLLDLNPGSVNATITKGETLSLNVEESLRLVVDHQGLAIFFFVKNTSQLLTDRLYTKKLRDLSPFLNNTLIDLGDQMAAYCAFPTYNEASRGYQITLDTTRREFLSYLDYKIFLVFRDGSGHLHLVDRYFSKTLSSNLKVFSLVVSSPVSMSTKDVQTYIGAFTSLRHSLAPRGQSAATAAGRQAHSLLMLSTLAQDKVVQQLGASLFADRNLPLFKYYLYNEKGVVVHKEDWLRLENITEVGIENLEVTVAIEDIAAHMLKYSLELRPHQFSDFRDMLDFTAILKLSKKTDLLYEPNPKNHSEDSTTLSVFERGSLFLEKTFAGLETGSEYSLSVRPCIFFKNLALCNSRTVALY